MNEELVYHQIEINDKPMIAEFLIYDFRFWYEVEASFQYFHVIVVKIKRFRSATSMLIACLNKIAGI